MTKEEFLKDTIEFFTLDNRGFDPDTNNCNYHCIDGNKCAIGRYMTVEMADKSDYQNWDIDDIIQEKLLPKNVIDLGNNFLHDIQSLHDTESNWNDEGLSEEGKRNVDGIIYDFKLDKNKVYELEGNDSTGNIH